MNEFDLIMAQIGKTPFSPRISKWITLPELRSESDFTGADVVPDQPHSQASNIDPGTITKQVKKKKSGQKSKRDRISAKGVLLADRLHRNSYK
jgi:hypothetical protein